MPFCRTCNGHYFEFDRHTCPPVWRAWDIENEEEPDDGRDVRAHDGEDAAEEYVKTLEEVRDGDDFTIGVRQGSGPIERYRVTASLTWSYSTERVEDEEPETATITPTGEPVDEAQEAARTVRVFIDDKEVDSRVIGWSPDDDHPAATARKHDDEEPPREAVEPLVGMPRYRRSGAWGERIEIDGRRPGGVRVRFVSLGYTHSVEILAVDVDGEPCHDRDELERLVLRDLDERYGVKPDRFDIEPIEVPDGC